MSPMHSLYVLDGDRLIPTPLTGGPWRPDAQHGGPPSAALGRAIEVVTEEGEQLARVTVELLRPIPLVPLRIEVERTVMSRRVTHVDAVMVVADGSGHDGTLAEGTVVAAARGLVLAESAMPTPDYAVDESGPLIGPEAASAAPDWTSGPDATSYHRDAVEHRPVTGGFVGPGPADQWIRLRYPLVDGEETSALCRVLATADFGSGVSAIYAHESGVGLINADLTVSLHRPLIGEWVRLQSITRVGPSGVGLCTTILSDEQGPIGAALQSLLGT